MWLVAWIAGLLLSASCSGEHAVLLEITSELPAEVQQLQLDFSIAGRSGRSQTVDAALRQIAISVPDDAAGNLVISASGITATQCVGAHGEVTVPLGGARYPLTATLLLTAVRPSQCSVTVSIDGGAGRIVSPTGEMLCQSAGPAQSCTLQYPLGSQLVLQAVADPSTYAYSWSGSCMGRQDCRLEIAGKQSVNLRFARRGCQKSGWCWYAALPQGNNLLALWPGSDSDIWAVGENGTILQYDGSLWQPAPESGQWSSYTLRAVWGRSATDLWAVGDRGLILHYDGKHWQEDAASGSVTTVDLHGIWGDAANNLWVVGSLGTILHRDDNGFTARQRTNQTLYGVYGSDSSHVYAVGAGNTVLSYDGADFSLQNVGSVTSAVDWRAVWTADAAVWVVGTDGNLLRNSGTGWSNTKIAANHLYALKGRNASDLWVSGDSGTLLHFDGSGWKPASGTGLPVSADLRAISVTPSAVWLVGAGGTISRGDSVMDDFHPILNQLTAMWGSRSGTLWTVGLNGQIASYQAGQWTLSVTDVTDTLQGVWGANDSNIWAVGLNGIILHFDGQAWSRQQGPDVTSNFTAVWGSSASDIWAVTEAGTIWHSNGGLWTRSPVTGLSKGLYAIWGSGPNDIWSVGEQGTIVHFVTTSWTLLAQSPTTSTLFGLWGSDANNLWAVGQSGRILHYDGTDWSTQGTPSSSSLYSISGASPKDVWAVGAGGSRVHFDGTAWAATDASDSPATLVLRSVLAAQSGAVWAAGWNGLLSRPGRGVLLHTGL